MAFNREDRRKILIDLTKTKLNKKYTCNREKLLKINCASRKATSSNKENSFAWLSRPVKKSEIASTLTCNISVKCETKSKICLGTWLSNLNSRKCSERVKPSMKWPSQSNRIIVVSLLRSHQLICVSKKAFKVKITRWLMLFKILDNSLVKLITSLTNKARNALKAKNKFSLSAKKYFKIWWLIKTKVSLRSLNKFSSMASNCSNWLSSKTVVCNFISKTNLHTKAKLQKWPTNHSQIGIINQVASRWKLITKMLPTACLMPRLMDLIDQTTKIIF